MDKQEMLKRFQSPDEKLLFSKVLDRLFLCQKERQKVFTPFLDPAHLVQYEEIIQRHSEEQIMPYGGAAACERKMLGFAPAFGQLEFADFPIDRLIVAFPAKFGHGLSHRDFLGSLTGLGIDRGKIGDIVISGGEADVYAHRDVSSFICANLERVGRVKASASIAQAGEGAYWGENGEFKPDDGRWVSSSVSSLRVDAVISSIFGLPRGDSAKLVGGGKASVNWAPVAQSDKTVREGDVITVRGYGRAKLESVEAGRKKGRFTIRAVKYS